jgi:hypothetical protein
LAFGKILDIRRASLSSEILGLPPLRPEKMKAEWPLFFLGPRARIAGEPKGLKGGKPIDQ